MATNFHLGTAGANAEASALAVLLNSGYLRIYDGSQPADAKTAITDQNLLAELRFGATAFDAPIDGVMAAKAITSATAARTGTASWYRCFQSDGTTVVMDGNVGTAASNLNIATTAIQQNATVSVSSLSHTVTE